LITTIYAWWNKKLPPWYEAYQCHVLAYNVKGKGSRKPADLKLASMICAKGYPLLAAIAYYWWRVFGWMAKKNRKFKCL